MGVESTLIQKLLRIKSTTKWTRAHMLLKDLFWFQGILPRISKGKESALWTKDSGFERLLNLIRQWNSSLLVSNFLKIDFKSLSLTIPWLLMTSAHAVLVQFLLDDSIGLLSSIFWVTEISWTFYKCDLHHGLGLFYLSISPIWCKPSQIPCSNSSEFITARKWQ